MAKLKILLAATMALASFATVSPAVAATTLSMAGDADCFGLGGSCPAGTLWSTQLGGSFFSSYATAGDPAFTDAWNAYVAPTYLLSYSSGTNVSLQMKIAGIADTGVPYNVLFNGTNIGQITTNNGANAFQEVRIFNFSVAQNLLLATNLVTIGTTGGDGYSVDYLSLIGDSSSAVPEPATWGMMILGFGMIGAAARSRKTKTAVRFA